MKKNRVMRFASVILILTLLSTSVISGTFAKYVTKVEGTDTGRVATWGFVSEYGTNEVQITDLFKTAYDKNVQGTADVIAPGTTNSASFAFKYAGQEAAPEVAYTFAVSVEGSTVADDIKTNPNIQWRLDNGAWGTWDQLMASIKALSGDASGSKTYAAGELPTGFSKTTANHTIVWQWIFETANDTDQDELDTAMGNKADLDDVTIQITVTATQID